MEGWVRSQSHRNCSTTSLLLKSWPPNCSLGGRDLAELELVSNDKDHSSEQISSIAMRRTCSISRRAAPMFASVTLVLGCSGCGVFWTYSSPLENDLCHANTWVPDNVSSPNCSRNLCKISAGFALSNNNYALCNERRYCFLVSFVNYRRKDK